MGKAEENKQEKKNKLMDTAFALFTSKGIAQTSISDIVERAGMAKGTFYLYFRDKYELQEKLVEGKSRQLFDHAMQYSCYEEYRDPADQVLAILGDILNEIQKDPLLLRFINKNLSWGIFRKAIGKSEEDYLAVFRRIYPDLPEKDVTIAVYLIIELVGSTCHSVILEKNPTDLASFRPYLYRSVRAILGTF